MKKKKDAAKLPTKRPPGSRFSLAQHPKTSSDCCCCRQPSGVALDRVPAPAVLAHKLWPFAVEPTVSGWACPRWPLAQLSEESTLAIAEWISRQSGAFRGIHYKGREERARWLAWRELLQQNQRTHRFTMTPTTSRPPAPFTVPTTIHR